MSQLAPLIAAIAIIVCMMYVGSLAGHLFGWSDMDCIYLGGMLAMSSTTIMMRRGGNSENVNRLWYEGGRIERIKITACGILRLVLGAAFITFIIAETLPRSGMYGVFAIIATVLYILFSSRLEKHSDRMTKTFTENLHVREHQE